MTESQNTKTAGPPRRLQGRQASNKPFRRSPEIQARPTGFWPQNTGMVPVLFAEAIAVLCIVGWMPFMAVYIGGLYG